MRTRLTERYELETPIVGAPLGALSGPELVAAVSNAGGLGMLGTFGDPHMNVGHLRASIRVTMSLTNRPFGVNLLTPYASSELVTACAELQVAAVSFHLGVPPDAWLQILHEADVPWWQKVGSIESAQRALSAGAHALVVQGSEAGGANVGASPLFSLLPAIADLSDDPLILAAGGIGDGRGIAAALALGADGVCIGTRLVATDEAYARNDYKRRIVSALPGETFLQRVKVENSEVCFRLLTAPPVTGEFTVESSGDVIGYDQIRVPTPDADGSLSTLSLLAGESAALVHDVSPARDVIRRLHNEAVVVLQQRLIPLVTPRLVRRSSAGAGRAKKVVDQHD